MRVLDFHTFCGGIITGLHEAGATVLAANPHDYTAEIILRANFLDLKLHDIALCKLHEIPRVDIVCFERKNYKIPVDVLSALQPRFIIAEGNNAQNPPIKGYTFYSHRFTGLQYGLPINTIRYVHVGLRADLKFKCAGFPFPETIVGKPTLEPLLEDSVFFSGQLLTNKEALIKNNERNKKHGVGFRCKILGPSDHCFSLAKYYRDGTEALIKHDDGVRRLSVQEFKQIVGFSKEYSVPTKRTLAYRALGVSAYPPYFRLLAEELRVWFPFGA